MITRSRTHKKIAGVCGGISEHFEIDVSLVRLVTLFLILGIPGGWMVYLAAWILLPYPGEKAKYKSWLDD